MPDFFRLPFSPPVRHQPLFQAEIPAFLGSADESEENHQESYKDSLNICVWEPSTAYSPEMVEAYVKEAVEHGFTVEQALGILLFNKYDVAQSKADLEEYAPNEDPIDAWDEDDRVLFEIAYRLNSKSFAKIRATDLQPHPYKINCADRHNIPCGETFPKRRLFSQSNNPRQITAI